MKIACQENKVPGDTFQEKVDNLERFGFAGVELMHGHLAERLSEVKQALSNSSVQASTICTGTEHDLLGVTKDDRAARMERFKGLLALAGELGLVGVIAVPVRGRTPIFPDLSPYQTGADLERNLYVELLREAGESAAREGTSILVEPLNRYETHLANTLADGAAICAAADHPNVNIMADFFHMSIEEADIAASIRGAAQYVKHVHLADSNRTQPGTGHTEFRSGFAALQEIGFDGFMALECGITGDPEESLPATAAYLKSCMA